jgi:hypothetical protein
MPTEITINNVSGNVEFETVSVAASETVFWHNEDTTQPHWPNYQGQPMTRTQVGAAPSTNSDSWPIPLKPPSTITYQCSLHAGESGVIQVYANLAAGNSPLPAGVAGQAYAQQSLSAGGLAPFTWSVAPGSGAGYGVPPGLSIGQTSGSAAAVVIAGTPSAAGNYLFTIAVTDAAGNNFQQQNFTIAIS